MALTTQQVEAFFSDCRAKDAQQKNSFINDADYIKHMQEVEDFILGKTTTMPNMRNVGWNFYSWGLRDLPNLIPVAQSWGIYEERILSFVFHKNNKDLSWWMEYWMRDQIAQSGEFDVMAQLAPILKKSGMKDKDILMFGMDNYDDPYFLYEEGANDTENPQTDKPSSFGKYVLSFLPQQARLVMDANAEEDNSRFELCRLLYYHHRETLNEYVDEFIVPKSGYHHNGLDSDVVNFLLEKDAPFFEKEISKAIEKQIKQQQIDPIDVYSNWKKLDKAFPGKYESQLTKFYKDYLDQFETGATKGTWGYSDEYSWDDNQRKYLTVLSFEDMLERDPVAAQARLVPFIKNSPFLVPDFLTFLDEKFGADALKYWPDTLSKNPKDVGNEYFKTLFEIIEKYDFSSIEDSLWDLTKTKSKRIRFMLATVLSKLGDKAIARSKDLLNAKTADTRQTAALILAKINTEESIAILSAAFNSEKNDDARDVMLESLANKLYGEANDKLLADMIEFAKQRGKISESPISWIKPDALPTLYKTDGTAVTTDEVIFLLYRMSRAKGIRPDLEAKVLLSLIDRSKSGDFAKKLFKLYIDNGADAKQKYCLTLAGLLGDDETVNLLRNQVNTWVDNSRGKMAEYAVGALAMIGSNKALRTVEFFSRKYQNKNSNVGSAAHAALEEAAEELGMDMNELADSIIPDFDFDGMFKTFTVNDSEYRAFIDVNFKMAFLDEDGKKLKSAPKGTAKEVQDEFKLITKEVRDVVKSQSPRLEQYMVTGRRWELEAWQKFFLSNPIMFVYATRLVWGAFDANGQLLTTFWCAEDTSLMSLEDEEVELSEETATIGMIHPLMITPEEREAWNQKFFDLHIEPIFPQMQREVITIDEKEKAAVESSTFSGKKIEQGALYLAKTLEKLGWRRAEVSDGGYVPAYEKAFPHLRVRAEIETEGITVGYYDEDAYLGRLHFESYASENYGNKLAFGNIPGIVYSEVMADLRKILPPAESKEGKE
ncbi:DUF4132 domain-containing protein [Cytophagaceae bacterium DM2B3-1]|uniref:DUF4132 domain-containing protein n=1 Tax=Xanthocytophaga flava TaxID=3048013 RepID=A0ABT7CQW0_9BACT|nr:DUF4132 domain-containing protein [Xanthocytophaga flavus]MDJ1496142.1 DUF4132 domain-containing protein [Xanthocytophaga flavus]